MFFHPQLRANVAKQLSGCIVCTLSKAPPKTNAPYGRNPLPHRRQLWYCDLFKARGNTRIFIAVEAVSLYTFALALPSKKEEEILRAIMILYGQFRCTHIKFDQEQGTVTLLPQLKDMGIELLLGSAYSPESQGLAEQRVNLAKETYRHILLDKRNAPDYQLIAFVVAALNERIPSHSAYSSDVLMFGNSIPKLSDILPVAMTYKRDFIQRLNEHYTKWRHERADRQREKHNFKKRTTRFAPGDVVFCRVNPIRGDHLLKPQVRGPMTVLESSATDMTVTVENQATKQQHKVRTSQCYPADNSFSKLMLHDDWATSFIPRPREVGNNK